MAANNSTSNPINLSQTMVHFGFKPVDPWQLLQQINGAFGTVIYYLLSWVYFISEMAVLVGAFVFIWGAIGHHSRIKQIGTRIVLYAVLGFLAALILPGIILWAKNKFP